MASKAANKLRVFASVDDLLDNNDNEFILKWVNAHARALEGRKGYQTKYQAQRRILMKAARQILDADELAAIERQAEKNAAALLEKEEEAQ